MAGTAFFQQIKQCKNCLLFNNQKPLLDIKSKADVVWVGLSAVRVERPNEESPLSSLTNSGKLIDQIEELNKNLNFYRTNLVKCLPESNNKIRYPLKEEMNSCYDHLESEIDKFKPKVVVLLGKQVGEFVSEDTVTYTKNFDYKPIIHDGTAYISIEHPSYILVYKRKKLKQYIKKVSQAIGRYA